MRYSNRLFLYAPFIILLIVAAIAMLHWRQVANDWQTKLQAANNGREIAPGVTLRFASEQIGGFPFNIDVVLDNLVLSVQSTRGPISFRSERFAIHALTYGRAQQVMEAAGLQTLNWTDAEGGVHLFGFIPGSLRASAIEQDGHLARFDLDLDTFGSHSLTGTRAQLHFRTAPDLNALDFVIRADGLRVESHNSELPHVEIEGRIVHAAPLIPFLSGQDEWRRALGAWRGDKGDVRLDSVDIDWDASHLTGSGTLLLDDNNCVGGKIKMQLDGADQWKPTRLVESHFTSALQELARAALPSPDPVVLSLEIHNGAALLGAAGTAKSAGTLDPVF